MSTDLRSYNCIKGWQMWSFAVNFLSGTFWSAIHNAHKATFSWTNSSLHFMAVFDVVAMLITCSKPITLQDENCTHLQCVHKNHTIELVFCVAWILTVLHPPTFFYQSQQKFHNRNILFLPNSLIIHSIRAQVSQLLSFLILITGNQKRKPISSYNFTSPLLSFMYA